MLKKIADRKWIIISFLIIYIGIFLICSCNMFAQDEYNYSNIAWTSARINSFGDILKSQSSIYKNWSGRIPILFMVQSFLYLGKTLYDLINPLIFLLFIVMILKIANNKISIKGIFIVLLFVVFGTYKFWEKYIWISGSLNYLWPVTLMLIIIYYLYNIINSSKRLNTLNTIILLVTSFITGWSHENTVFVLGSFIIFLFIFNLKKVYALDKNTKVKLVLSIILFGIGAMILIFCPGNFGRLSSTTRKITIVPILKNVLALYKIIIIYIITVIFLKKSKTINSMVNTKEILKGELRYFILPILLALLPMIIISEFPIRASLAYEVMIYIVILQNLQIIYRTYIDSHKRNINIVTSFVVIISILILYSKAIFACGYIKPYKNKIEKQIEEAISLGDRDIVISEFEHLKLAKFLGVYMDVFPKKTDTSIINYYMALYYNVNSITAVKDGYVNIEIYLNNEEKINSYNIINKSTNEVIAKRIEEIELPMPNTSTLGVIRFEIPIKLLNNLYIDLPESIKENIVNIKLKTTLKTK